MATGPSGCAEMSEHLVVVAYDISDDRRRARLHRTLSAFGTPVQFSLFECRVSARDLEKLKAALRKVIRPRLDRVRLYHLCKDCEARTESSPAGSRAPDDPENFLL